MAVKDSVFQIRIEKARRKRWIAAVKKRKIRLAQLIVELVEKELNGKHKA